MSFTSVWYMVCSLSLFATQQICSVHSFLFKCISIDMCMEITDVAIFSILCVAEIAVHCFLIAANFILSDFLSLYTC